jgi:hypothetical protein
MTAHLTIVILAVLTTSAAAKGIYFEPSAGVWRAVPCCQDAHPRGALDEIARVNPQGITKREVETLLDWCRHHPRASMCVKMKSR